MFVAKDTEYIGRREAPKLDVTYKQAGFRVKIECN
jgi:hypothetical protein